MSVAQLEAAAAALGAELRSRVIFLGGATIALWMTDPAARAPRITYDVDVVAEVTTLAAYESFQADLRSRHFFEDVESGVICRWRHAGDDLVLDAVPLEARLAGFSGQWLGRAAAAAAVRDLPSGTTIRAIPPPYLLATKLEAFADRGHGDCLGSHDFEDIVLLIDSRQELVGELAAADPALRAYVRIELTCISRLSTFQYGLEGALMGSDARERARVVTLPRLQQLAAPL